MRIYCLPILIALYMVLNPPATVSANAAASAPGEPSAAESTDAGGTAGISVPPAADELLPKMPLQGVVEHRDSFAPVPPELMPGGKFDESVMPKPIPGNNWYPVPDWMAGTWQFKTETVTYMRVFDKKKYPAVPFTLKNEFQKTFGLQKDKTGQIWDYLKAPCSYTAKLEGGYLGYINETEVTAIKADDKEVLRKLVGPDAVVDPDTQEILLTNQKECFTRYTKFGDGAVHVDGSTKIFNMNGKPTVLKISNQLALRVKPFEIVDEQDGQNLKQMFSDFLKAQGKADLVP